MPDTTLHPTFAAILAPVAPPVTVETGDGWLVISKSRQPKSVVPPYAYDYHYDHFVLLVDAEDHYAEIERGEYRNREAVAIASCRKGVPLGAKVLP